MGKNNQLSAEAHEWLNEEEVDVISTAAPGKYTPKAAFRATTSPGPRGLYYTSSSCCRAAPLEGGGKQTVGWRALLLRWSLTPLLWSFAGQAEAVVFWYVTEKYICVSSYFDVLVIAADC